jgi:hypothetical protein
MKYTQRLKKIERQVKPEKQLPLVLWDREPTEKEKNTREVIQVVWQ